MQSQDIIYFDYQATTPMDDRVVEAMLPFFSEKFGNPHSTDHAIGWEASQAVENSAAEIAKLIGAEPDEIFFTSGATESNNLALLGIVRGELGKSRNRILVSSIEHKSVLSTANYIGEKLGFHVEIIPVDKDGIVALSELEALIDEQVLIVSIMHVNNEIGTIQKIDEIGKLCESNGVLLHSDGAQAPGSVDISHVSNIVDTYSLSAHKFYGPKGLGVLYIKRSLQQYFEPMLFGGNQQNQIRSGTIPTFLCIGTGKAAEIINLDQSNELRNQTKTLRNNFYNAIENLNWGTNLNGPSFENRHPGNVSVQFEGFNSHELLNSFQPFLAASTGSACTSGNTENSHVLRAIGLNEDQIDSSIRFSLGRYTKKNDVDKAAKIIETGLMKLSSLNGL